jgi:hypothetical protein
MQNLISRVKLMMAPDGAGGGSAEGGVPAAANAEDSLLNAFSNTKGADAGAGGGKPEAKPGEGSKAAGGTQTAGGVKLAAWAEQLPPEMRENPETQAKLAKFGKVGDMAKAFLELESKAAGAVLPGKNAAAEEAAAFWEKAGRPKEAGKYAFAGDKEHGGGEFAEAAFKANLTSAQAEALFKSLGEMGTLRLQAAVQAQQQQAAQTAAALSAEYGSKYEEKIELLKRGLAAAGPNVGSLLSQAGLAGNPEIVKAFIAFGQMTAESGASRGGGAGEPLQSVFEGATFDYKT